MRTACKAVTENGGTQQASSSALFYFILRARAYQVLIGRPEGPALLGSKSRVVVEFHLNIQGTFRAHSGHIQGTFRAHSGHIQSTFREPCLDSALCIRHTRHSERRPCATYMSHPSPTWQAVRSVYVTPITQTAGGALRLCHTHHSNGRRCVTYMSHPSLTWQAVRSVYVTPVTQVYPQTPTDPLRYVLRPPQTPSDTSSDPLRPPHLVTNCGRGTINHALTKHKYFKAGV
jgi:hypothetical protein